MNNSEGDISVAAAKQALRLKMRAALKNVTPEERISASESACAILRHTEGWRRASSVLLYAPLSNEINIEPLLVEALAEGKLVALPRYVPETNDYTACRVTSEERILREGRFGILEPGDQAPAWPLNQLDFALVPGVAFDLHGHRLGRGKGFYDRLLAGVLGTKCGIGFDLQIEAAIPFEPHDIVLDCILTPSRFVQVNARPVLR